MPTDLLAVMKADPVRGFVGVPLAAGKPEGKGADVTFLTGQGKPYLTLRLPIWPASAWVWWASGAVHYAELALGQEFVGLGSPSRVAVESALGKLAPVIGEMSALGAQRPPAELVARLYDRAVRVVINAKHVRPGESLIAVWLGDWWADAPITVVDTLKWMGGAGETAIRDVARAAGRAIAAMGGGLLAGLGTAGALLLGYVLYEVLASGDRD